MRSGEQAAAIERDLFDRFCPGYLANMESRSGSRLTEISTPLLSQRSITLLSSTLERASLLPLLELSALRKVFQGSFAPIFQASDAERETFSNHDSDEKWTLQTLAYLAAEGPHRFQTKGQDCDWEQELAWYRQSDEFRERTCHLCAAFGTVYSPSEPLYSGLEGEASPFRLSLRVFFQLFSEPSLAGIALRTISKTHRLTLEVQKDELPLFTQLISNHTNEVIERVGEIVWCSKKTPLYSFLGESGISSTN